MVSIQKQINDRFIKVADAVSFGMGTPTNIIFWLVAVLVWFMLGAFRSSWFESGHFLPSWFTSTAWNFPLNTITTLAELYIGFLVAAATNRSERELRKIIEGMKRTVDKVEDLTFQQNKLLEMMMKYERKDLAEDAEIKELLMDLEINGFRSDK